MYGRGIYFTAESCKATRYSKEVDQAGCHCLSIKSKATNHAAIFLVLELLLLGMLCERALFEAMLFRGQFSILGLGALSPHRASFNKFVFPRPCRTSAGREWRGWRCNKGGTCGRQSRARKGTGGGCAQRERSLWSSGISPWSP